MNRRTWIGWLLGGAAALLGFKSADETRLTPRVLAQAVEHYIDRAHVVTTFPGGCRELVVYGVPADDNLGKILAANGGEMTIKARATPKTGR